MLGVRMLTRLRNVSVSLKVALAPTFAIVCMALVCGIGFFANERLSSSLIVLGEKEFPASPKTRNYRNKSPPFTPW